jgi:hypothetical protein
MFDYSEIEILGDLERLKLFLENIEDNKLCEELEKSKKNGRNDYPIRTMLNLIYAMKIFGHRSVESFRRELSRNSQLRIVCGLSDGKYKYFKDRKNLIPPARVFSMLLKKLTLHQDIVDDIFESLVEFMYENLESFGEDAAVDGKYLDTYANKYNKEKCKDNRAEHEATSSCKQYVMKDGTIKKEWHYGFRAHIICDANYGLPIKYTVTPANISEQKELDNIIIDMENNEKYKLDKMVNILADAGYDNGVRNKKLKEEYNINPIVDIRHMWSKDEKYREIENQMLAYNQDGEVFFIKDDNTYEKLKYLGYDKINKALRYTRYETGNNVYRIALDTDRRIFTPVARDSNKFKKLYKKRTEVERLNGRIDRDYMFNDHFIRGQKKMNLMLSISFIVMLTLAKGKIKNKKIEDIRKFVA